MFESFVKIPIDDFYLAANLSLPVRAKNIVIFSHGSGSNRFSPRNKMIARELRKAGFGTLLFDYMDEQEEENYEKRFEIDTLCKRLVSVTNWILDKEKYKNYDIAYFGAGMGAVMAFNAAGKLGDKIKAIACRGAQTELIDEKAFSKITCPVLLIAGERDTETIKRNRKVLEKLSVTKKLVTIDGAGHLMEKPHMMDRVAKETIEWYKEYLERDQLKPELEYDIPDSEY